MGGEDRHLFQRFGMAGYKIVWANEAVVTEWVPSNRTTNSWLIRRYYRVGNSTSFIERDLRSFWVVPLLACKSLAWMAIGAGLLVSSPLRGRHAAVQGWRACAYGAGLLTGLLGIPFEEYRRGDNS